VKLLLDTCTFLWLTLDAPALSAEAKGAVRDPENDVYLSAVSTWEIAVQCGLRRLRLPEDPATWVPKQRRSHLIEALPLDEAATLQLPKLPLVHRDPFDRMLICQAISSGLVLVTPDPVIGRYPVAVLW
jgi:PIN domain nuclease of toxin-antitoxin system